MRRVLIVFAAVAVVVAVAFPQKQASTAFGPSGSVQPMILAQGLATRGLAVGPDSTVYVTLLDPANRLFTLDFSVAPSNKQTGPAFAAIAGTGTSGSLGDGGPAISAQLSLLPAQIYERSGVAVGLDGTIYVADSGNATIRAIAGGSSSEPGIIRSVAGRWAARQDVTLTKPLGLALDRLGDLYIADHGANALDVLRHGSGLLETMAQITSPASVAVTSDGTQAYIASPESGAVFALNLQTHSLTRIQELGGVSNSSSISETPPCSAGSNQLCPAGLAVDGAGNLFVSDSTLGRILRVDARTGTTTTALTGLQRPGAISFDQQGRNLYISEQGLNRILEAQGLGDPPPNLSLSPSSWTDSQPEPISGVSAQQQFTLTNNSGASISGLQIASPGPPTSNGAFTLESTSCLSTLASNASCSINVSFTPTALGQATSTLSVTDSNQDSASATLAGTGDDYQIELANGQPKEISVVEGNAATFHFQVAVSGVFGQMGEQVSIFCPGDTPQRSTCTVTPPTVTPTSTSSASFAVTIQTSSVVTQAKQPPPFALPPLGSPFRKLFAALLLGVLAIILFAIYSRRFRRLGLVASAATVVLMVVGCHHASHQLLSTPAGPVNLVIQGSALDKNGTSLNATRGITVTLDVLEN